MEYDDFIKQEESKVLVGDKWQWRMSSAGHGDIEEVLYVGEKMFFSKNVSNEAYGEDSWHLEDIGTSFILIERHGRPWPPERCENRE